MLRRIFFALLVALLYSSCSKDAIAPQDTITVPSGCDSNAIAQVRYLGLDNVKEIINSSCANQSGCHVPGESNYDFTKYEVVADRIRSGRFTERILLPLSHPLHMPVGAEMTACDLAKLMTWINNGFPEN